MMPRGQTGRRLRPCLGWALLLLFAAGSAHANLIRNPSFESIPGPLYGQGLLPLDWDTPGGSGTMGPDTYSTDDSFGLAPEAYGNFSGVTAFDGLRWVAGWSAVPERIEQVLTAPLTPGSTYEVSVWLHTAVRSDLAHPGSYEIGLASNTSLANLISVGELLPLVSNGDAWQLSTLVFVAPPDAATLPVLVFTPVATDAGPSYPGMDLVTLTEGIPAGTAEPVGAGGPSMPLNIIAYPNPTAGHVTFRLGIPREGPLAVSIIDLRGRIIRRLGPARLVAGTDAWTWDGDDSRENPVPSGIYFYKLTTPEGGGSQKLLLIRP